MTAGNLSSRCAAPLIAQPSGRHDALRKALALERSHGAEAVTKEENERLRSEVTQMRAQVEPLLCDHICKPTSVTTSVTTSVNPHL